MFGSTESHERGLDASGIARVDGDRAAAERLLRSAIQRLEGFDGTRLELASALIRVGTLRQEIGNHAEAEELFRKAIEVGERAPASDDNPDLVILLNDLTRLCLKHSAHAAAEPLLLRLLTIKRSKGEDHPEVATVLASLAVVRQALGQHESAELLWRRVLHIRERTLAPNHFALATALEHLAEACEARGKLAEALQLLERALTIRERTLGGDHTSLRMSRERIADLQLQASENTLETQDAATPGLAPDRLRLLSAKRTDAPAGLPVERESDLMVPGRGAPPVVEHNPSMRLTEQDAVMPPLAPAAMADTDPTQPAAVPYRDIILSIAQEFEDTPEQETLRDRASALFASAVALVRERQKAVVVGAGAMAFLLIALAADTHAWGEPDQAQVDAVARLRAVPSEGTASLPNVSPRPITATSDPLNISNPVAATSSSLQPPPKSRPADERSSGKKVSDKKADRPGISIPRLPQGVMTRLDSVVGAVSVASPDVAEPATTQPAMSANAQRPSFLNAESSNSAPIHARLIGEVPKPSYPRELSGVEGEVVARFSVDASGRPLMSTFSVVKTPDPLLTAAVRRVIPSMRFEPARTGGPDSKPTIDAIEISFQFRASR